jgi:Carbohydrate-selective porin, OprB family/S-layer homology domain
MTRYTESAWLVSPALLVAALLVSPGAVGAKELSQNIPQTGETQLAQVSDLPLSAPANGSFKQSDPLGQVTSVSQLTDVDPTHWAFQALQSLVERYGCIEGYPDRTYRGNRALTRYEFAAGLNACLDRIQELIAAAVADLPSKDDIATIRRLQEEFAAELATLRGRVDALEARTAKLEAQQFSTTTKLTGEVIFALTDSFGEDNDNNTVFQNRVRLNFNTSFSGRDLLLTRLQAGNGNPLDFTNNNNGFEFINTTREGFQAHQVFGNNGNDIVLDTLLYSVPVGNVFTLTLLANRGRFEDFTPTLNPFLEDFDGGSGSISAFAQRNPIYRIGGGQGIGLSFKPARSLEITAGYLAPEGSSPLDGRGLFNGSYAALGQITWTPISRFAIAATYNRAYFGTGEFGFDNGALNGIGNGFTGTSLANLIGTGSPVTSDSIGIQMTARLHRHLQLNAWAGYTNVDLIDDDIEGEIWNGAIALAFPDAGKRGNVAALVVGVEPYLTSLDGFNDFFKQDIPFHVEGFYKIQVTNNISITPGVIWLTAPNQDADNDDIIIGTIRTTFRF